MKQRTRLSKKKKEVVKTYHDGLRELYEPLVSAHAEAEGWVYSELAGTKGFIPALARLDVIKLAIKKATEELNPSRKKPHAKISS